MKGSDRPYRLLQLTGGRLIFTIGCMENGPEASSSQTSTDEADAIDVELMRRIQADDREAFGELIHRHQDLLLNFFRRMGVYDYAEDLVQETFLKLYQYRKRYSPRAAFRTFLYRMAGQLRVDRLRKLKRRQALARLLHARQRAAPAKSPDKTEVQEMLAYLPDGMRQVVVLRIYHTMKYAEIAEAMDIPVGTVKSRMFNALRTLRNLMGGDDEDT